MTANRKVLLSLLFLTVSISLSSCGDDDAIATPDYSSELIGTYSELLVADPNDSNPPIPRSVSVTRNSNKSITIANESGNLLSSPFTVTILDKQTNTAATGVEVYDWETSDSGVSFEGDANGLRKIKLLSSATGSGNFNGTKR